MQSPTKTISINLQQSNPYYSSILRPHHSYHLYSPKVTQIIPQIKSVQKFKIRRHHLDDSEMKETLRNQYQEGQRPRVFHLRASKVVIDKKDKNNTTNSNRMLKLNSQYYQDNHQFQQNQQKPTRNAYNDMPDNQYSSKNSSRKNFKSQQPQRIHQYKSVQVKQSNNAINVSNPSFETKLLSRLNNIQGQNNKILILLKQKQMVQQQQKSIQNEKKNKNKKQKQLVLLKHEIQKQNKKNTKNIQKQLDKIKRQSQKVISYQNIKKQQQNGQHIIPNQQANYYLINAQKQLNQLITKQLKNLPKTNIMNKRIQCQIQKSYQTGTKRYMSNNQRLKTKRPFAYSTNSQTDSNFSEF